MATFLGETLIVVVLAVVCRVSAQDYATIGDCIQSLPPAVDHKDQVEIGTWHVLFASQRVGSKYGESFFRGKSEDACIFQNACFKTVPVPSNPFEFVGTACNNVALRRPYSNIPGSGYNATLILQNGTKRNSLARTVQSGPDYILYYNCQDDGSKDFEVYSLKRSLSAESQQAVTDKLDKDGWSRLERVRTFNDRTCA